MTKNEAFPDMSLDARDVRRADFELSPSYQSSLERGKDGSFIPSSYEFDNKSQPEKSVLLYTELNDIFEDAQFTEDIMTTISLASELAALSPEYVHVLDPKKAIASTLKAYRGSASKFVSKDDLKLILVQRAAVCAATTYKPYTWITTEASSEAHSKLDSLSGTDKERAENIEAWVKDKIASKLGKWLPLDLESADATGVPKYDLGVVLNAEFPHSRNDVIRSLVYKYEEHYSQDTSIKVEKREMDIECANYYDVNGKGAYLSVTCKMHDFFDPSEADDRRSFHVRLSEPSDTFMGDTTSVEFFTENGKVTSINYRFPGAYHDSYVRVADRTFDSTNEKINALFEEKFGVGVPEVLASLNVHPERVDDAFMDKGAEQRPRPNDSKEAMTQILGRLKPLS